MSHTKKYHGRSQSLYESDIPLSFVSYVNEMYESKIFTVSLGLESLEYDERIRQIIIGFLLCEIVKKKKKQNEENILSITLLTK